MTNMHRWDRWYSLVEPDAPQAYGDTTTYHIAAAWLEGLTVEDWGCGMGFFRTLIPAHLYTGVDGSNTPFADKIVDLCVYRSSTEAVLLRHVLEHNEQWSDILSNALASATRRVALILFTPMAERTTAIGSSEELGVPDISFSHDALMAHFGNYEVQVQDLQTKTQYGVERIYLLERSDV